MSLILKISTALALLATAFWTVATVRPHPASPPLPWTTAAASIEGVTDTLSVEAAVGQLVAAAGDRDIAGLVALGHVGRVEIGRQPTATYLDSLRSWQGMATLPLAVATPAGDDFSLPAPVDVPSGAMLGATARPDLGFVVGKAVSEAARDLSILSPGTPLVLAAGASRFGPIAGGPVEQALVRGLRSGGVLPSARLLPSGLDALDALASAGLMEVRLAVRSDDDVATIRALKERGAFTGLVVAEVDDHARGAVAAVKAGADVVQSSAPAVVFDSLRSAVDARRVNFATVREAARRVLAAKAWSGLDVTSRPERESEGGGVVRVLRGRAVADQAVWRSELLRAEVARRAATVVQDSTGPLPLVGAHAPRTVLTVLLDPSAGDRALTFANTLGTAVAPEIRGAYVRLGLGLPEERYVDAEAAALSADLIVLAAFPDDDGALAARHRQFAEALLGSAHATVLTVLGDADLAAGLPRPNALVVAYGADDAAQAAAAQAIAGEIDVAGTLPRGVAGLAAAGAGQKFRQQRLRPGSATEAGLGTSVGERIDAVMDAAVRSGAFPGGAVAVGRDGVLLRLKGYGRLSRTGGPVTPDTPYDLASLTKVVGTTAVTMQLVEEGRLDLDAQVVRYLPEYRGLGKERVTVRQLLAHAAGHRPFYPFYAHDIRDKRGVMRFIYADTLQYTPGTRSVYSDFDMIVLGEVIEAITGDDIDEVYRRRVFEPLGMASTGFREVGVVDRTVAPTESDEIWRHRILQGEVHDEAASVMGGVAGHAGLFSTASDLSRFAFALAEGGDGYGSHLVRRSTLDLFTRSNGLRSTYPAGLGWMLTTGPGNSAAGSHFGPRTFGHTGFTGTSIWIDPDQGLFVILLTNRVYPTRRNTRIRGVRTELADAVAGAVVAPPGAAYRAWGFGPLPDDLPTYAVR